MFPCASFYSQVVDWQLYDTRYVSFHTVDFGLPMPSYRALSDGQMWYHYGKGERAVGRWRRREEEERGIDCFLDLCI